MANTPEERARLWKKGRLDVDRYNRRNDLSDSLKEPDPKEIRTGPRGGKYRININGRKSYDVP